MNRLRYRLVLPVACLVLTALYLFDREASIRSRVAVAVLTALSFFLPAGVEWYIVAVLIQLGVSIFVILRWTYLRIW